MQTMRDPPRDIWTATLSDTVNEAKPFRAFMTDTTGDVKVTTIGPSGGSAQDVVLPSCIAGTWIACQGTRIWSTGTDGTVVALAG